MKSKPLFDVENVFFHVENVVCDVRNVVFRCQKTHKSAHFGESPVHIVAIPQAGHFKYSVVEAATERCLDRREKGHPTGVGVLSKLIALGMARRVRCRPWASKEERSGPFGG